MGYAFCLGSCINCGKSFTFNPMKVPSVRVSEKKEPICESCIRILNKHRVANGIDAISVASDAYDVCREEELY